MIVPAEQIDWSYLQREDQRKYMEFALSLGYSERTHKRLMEQEDKLNAELRKSCNASIIGMLCGNKLLTAWVAVRCHDCGKTFARKHANFHRNAKCPHCDLAYKRSFVRRVSNVQKSIEHRIEKFKVLTESLKRLHMELIAKNGYSLCFNGNELYVEGKSFVERADFDFDSWDFTDRPIATYHDKVEKATKAYERLREAVDHFDESLNNLHFSSKKWTACVEEWREFQAAEMKAIEICVSAYQTPEELEA